MADATVADKPGLDPTLPDVPVILGGVERKLCFDFDAIVRAEQATGINLLKGMVEFDARSLRGLLWAALLRHDPDVKLEQVSQWIKPRNIAGLRSALFDAWFASQAEPEEQPGEAAAPESTTATPAA